MTALKELYETDLYAWTRMQVRELRRLRDPRSNVELDLAHLIEEIWGLGSELGAGCYSQITRILEHLLKLQYSPAAAPRGGWTRSIIEARGELDDRLTPTIRNHAQRRMPKLYRRARKLAIIGLEEYDEMEAARRLPRECPYTLDDVLREDWYPEQERGRD